MAKISHTTKINSVKIVSVTALEAAVKHLAANGINCSLDVGGTPRAYSVGQKGMGPADYVIRLPEARFDIGLYKTKDGSFEARTDFYGGTVEGQLGAACPVGEAREEADSLGRLFHEYAMQVGIEQANNNGWQYSREPGLKAGEERLVCVQY